MKEPLQIEQQSSEKIKQVDAQSAIKDGGEDEHNIINPQSHSSQDKNGDNSARRTREKRNKVERSNKGEESLTDEMDNANDKQQEGTTTLKLANS